MRRAGKERQRRHLGHCVPTGECGKARAGGVPQGGREELCDRGLVVLADELRGAAPKACSGMHQPPRRVYFVGRAPPSAASNRAFRAAKLALANATLAGDATRFGSCWPCAAIKAIRRAGTPTRYSFAVSPFFLRIAAEVGLFAKMATCS